jgi:hypothetical protein
MLKGATVARQPARANEALQSAAARIKSSRLRNGCGRVGSLTPVVLSPNLLSHEATAPQKQKSFRKEHDFKI